VRNKQREEMLKNQSPTIKMTYEMLLSGAYKPGIGGVPPDPDMALKKMLPKESSSTAPPEASTTGSSAAHDSQHTTGGSSVNPMVMAESTRNSGLNAGSQSRDISSSSAVPTLHPISAPAPAPVAADISVAAPSASAQVELTDLASATAPPVLPVLMDDPALMTTRPAALSYAPPPPRPASDSIAPPPPNPDN
jgi:hypothetical protein